jgi:hypothetical protein
VSFFGFFSLVFCLYFLWTLFFSLSYNKRWGAVGLLPQQYKVSKKTNLMAPGALVERRPFVPSPWPANVPVLNQTGTKGEHWSQFVSRWVTPPAGSCPLAAYGPGL